MIRALPAPLSIRLAVPVMAVTFAAAFTLSVLRLPEALFRAEFWADDGYLYTLALERGARTIIEPPDAGYLMIAHRAVVYLETLVTPALAPLLGNATMLVVTAAAAAYATISRMPWDRRSGLLIALGIVLLPASAQLHGSLSHVMWPAALWMILVAISTVPATRLGRWSEGVGLVLAGTTGIGFLTAPLFLRGPRYRLLVVGAVAAMQVIVVLFGERLGGSAVWSLLPRIVLVRDFATPLLGPTLATAIPQVLVIALGAAVAATVAWYRPRWWMAYLFVLLPVAAMLTAWPTTSTLIDPNVSPRYFWLAGVALLALIVTRRAWPLLPLLVLGMVVELRLDPGAEVGWAERSACVGGPVACDIPVAPFYDWTTVRYRP